MRVYLTFVPNRGEGYAVSFLHEDAQTPYSRRFMVDNALTLAKIVAKLHGEVAEFQNSLRRWGQGGVTINPSPAQVKWMEERR